MRLLLTSAALLLGAALATPGCERAPTQRSDTTVRQLVVALREGDTNTRLSAVSSLRTFGRAAQTALPAIGDAMLNDRSSVVRMSAAAAIGELGPDAIPYLARAMGDEDEQVRASAVGALGAIARPDPALITALNSGLHDRSEIVRSRVVWAAERLGPDGATIVRIAASDRSSLVRSRAQIALQKLDADIADAGPASATHIAQIAKGLTHASASQRRKAAEQLAALGRDASPALPMLSNALRDPDRHVRLTSVAALSNLGHPAMPALLAATRDVDSGVRARAASGIGRFGTSGDSAVPTLAAMLRDGEVAVRLAAIGALERIGPAAKPALRTAASDASRVVRERAQRALENVDRQAAARAAAL